MYKILTILIIIGGLFLATTNCQQEQNQEEEEVFVPTKEWKQIKKGQKIPKGIHIRINLETGVKEGKLLDNEVPEQKRALTELTGQRTDDFSGRKAIPRSALEEAIKKIKNDDFANSEITMKVKNNYRSYEQLKKSFTELNITPKLEFEIITELLNKHKELTAEPDFDKDNILSIIEDLELLCHQFDNAIEFMNQNGFQEIIYKNLNSSVYEIRKETLRLLNSLIQNNNKPRIHAFETGAISILLRIIDFDSDSRIKARAVTALGALLRSFPIGQQKFVEGGGLGVLAKLFNNNDVKLKTKATILISDLVAEHSWALMDQKLTRFHQFDLIKHVLEHDWCENLNKLLLMLLAVDTEDHDSIEKCLTAMHVLKPSCADHYERNLIVKLQERYDFLSAEDEKKNALDIAYFGVLRDICDQILEFINEKNVKTEL